jgi:signal transduction histidine kinase
VDLLRVAADKPRVPDLRYALSFAAVSGLYVGAAKLGIALEVAHGVITPVWAPTGIAIAGLFLFGRGLWPAVALGAFVGNVTSGAGGFEALGISVGNTLEAVVGATLLMHVGVRPALDRVRDVFGFVLAAAVSPLVAASNGILVLWLSDKLHSPGSSWLLWWLGDGMGALIVAALLLVWSTKPWQSFPQPVRLLEAGVAAAALGGISAAVFFGGGWRYPYALFPALIWLTLRFRQPGAVTGSFIVAAIAVAGANNGSLPLGKHSPTGVVEILEGSLAGVVVSLFLLGAVLAERARALAGLAEAQRLARLGSWEWDIARNRVTWSDELFRLFGLEPQSVPMTYESYIERIHPDDREVSVRTVEQAYTSGEPFELQHRIVVPGVGIRWLQGHGQVVRDESGAPLRMHGTSQDVTERRRVDELRDSILAAVSHELRTPLASIVGFALTLQRHGQDLGAKTQAEIVERLTEEARRLERLLTDLLDLDRLRYGSVTASFRPTNLARLVGSVVADHLSDTRAIALEVKAVEADVDAPKVERIVDNLVANALRHTPDGSDVSVQVGPVDGGALIAVDDRGPGVGDDEREMIFEIFRRGGAGVASARGTGVGLALVAQFAALHGGRAWVEDNPGGGASFRVFLPSSPPRG